MFSRLDPSGLVPGVDRHPACSGAGAQSSAENKGSTVLLGLPGSLSRMPLAPHPQSQGRLRKAASLPAGVPVRQWTPAGLQGRGLRGAKTPGATVGAPAVTLSSPREGPCRDPGDWPSSLCLRSPAQARPRSCRLWLGPHTLPLGRPSPGPRLDHTRSIPQVPCAAARPKRCQRTRGGEGPGFAPRGSVTVVTKAQEQPLPPRGRFRKDVLPRGPVTGQRGTQAWARPTLRQPTAPRGSAKALVTTWHISVPLPRAASLPRTRSRPVGPDAASRGASQIRALPIPAGRWQGREGLCPFWEHPSLHTVGARSRYAVSESQIKIANGPIFPGVVSPNAKGNRRVQAGWCRRWNRGADRGARVP